MALQGTLETFSLPDVLQLLSSTKKSGCLRISGDRGDGTVWVADGKIVSGDASGAPHASDGVEVVFELLRFDDGEFVFDEGGDAPSLDDPVGVDDTLTAANRLLDEWKQIQSVVPSSEHWVSLTAEISDDDVTIGAADWKALVAIGSGLPFASLSSRLELGELAVARVLRSLSDLGVVQVGDPHDDEIEVVEVVEVVEEVDESPSAAVLDAPSPFDPDALVVEDRDPVSESTTIEDAAGVGGEEPETDVEPGEAAEIARQLANLSPKAARAVAVAAQATTDEERDAALAEVEASDEQINRELLLKFLGTV